MSVQILSRGHLNAIIHYAFMMMGPERRIIYTGHRAYHTDVVNDLTALMQHAHDANVKAWNDRYNYHQVADCMIFSPAAGDPLSEIRIIAACDRLMYNITGQSYDMRDALSAIKQYAVEHLPGYADAPADEGEV